MCGTFNSPQMLMLSGVGPSDELKSFGIKVVLDAPVSGVTCKITRLFT